MDNDRIICQFWINPIRPDRSYIWSCSCVAVYAAPSVKDWQKLRLKLLIFTVYHPPVVPRTDRSYIWSCHFLPPLVPRTDRSYKWSCCQACSFICSPISPGHKWQQPPPLVPRTDWATYEAAVFQCYLCPGLIGLHTKLPSPASFVAQSVLGTIQNLTERLRL